MVFSTQLPEASLRMLSFISEAVSSILVSRQALQKRVNGKACEFLGRALDAAASARIASKTPETAAGFRRIVLQDSTSLKLPARMSKAFPASGNQSSTTAGMRIHATFDLVARRFLGFAIRDACTPDQKHAVEGASGLGEGDLLIRDLGYFSVAAFSRILADGLHAITRYRLKLSLFDPKTGKTIDLLSLLRCADTLDMPILAGKKDRYPLRLVAFKLPEEVARHRRRAFRKTAKKKGRTPSKISLQLQSWQIYLTSCSVEELEAGQVRELYRQRWAIEILFKAFKTHMRFEQLPAYASETMLRCLVLAALLRITLTHTFISPFLDARSGAGYISSLKLYSLCEAIGSIGAVISVSGNDIAQCMVRHCLYENRERMSLPQKLATLG